MLSSATKFISISALLLCVIGTFAVKSQFMATSGPTITPVVELHTSEGCSSCPQAGKWASSLKDKNVLVRAFHVYHRDYIGWVGRFAAPAYAHRQRELAARNGQHNVYTPQDALDGKDLSGWSRWSNQPASKEPARASITLAQLGPDQFEANVSPYPVLQVSAASSVYWTITEHGHNSKVQAGGNAGEFLKHDFVVRQYTSEGEYKASGAPQKLALRSIAATPGHARQVNLVVFDSKTGSALQAVSLQCAV